MKLIDKICVILFVMAITVSICSTNVFASGSDENELEIMTNPNYQYKKGDVNMDGKMSIVDAVLIQRYLVELSDFTAKQTDLADVNSNGKIDVSDAILIQKKIIGVNTEESTENNNSPIELPFVPAR